MAMFGPTTRRRTLQLDFLVPGFSKCGTTALCSLLSQHPDIFIPDWKEPGFFAQHYEAGWSWYEKLFRPAGKATCRGEGSTTYSTWEYAEAAAERALEWFPELRFIFAARNPVTRLESSFREMHHVGHRFMVRTPYTIGEALEQIPNMIDDTRYWQLINLYRRRVPDERILVLFAEDLRQDPLRELRRCFEFLGVDPGVPIDPLAARGNSGTSKYYDTPRYRRLMDCWFWDCCKRPIGWHDRLAALVGLRRPFHGPVPWDTAALDFVKSELADDARQFLRFYGRGDDFWNWQPKLVTAERRAAA